MLRRILYVLQVLRLIVLMLIGAGIGYAPRISHSQAEMVEQQFSGAILGALCGLAVELVVRELLPIRQREIPTVRCSLRTLLIVTTLVAVVLGLIVGLR
jgi:hypothetical protein